MGKKSEWTPRSRIRSAIRKVWLFSRERHAAISRDRYTCCDCHRKASKAKGKEFFVEVHHRDGVQNWEKLIDAFYEFVLCHPDLLVTLCKECHDKREANKGVSEEGKEEVQSLRKEWPGRPEPTVQAGRGDPKGSVQQLRWNFMVKENEVQSVREGDPVSQDGPGEGDPRGRGDRG